MRSIVLSLIVSCALVVGCGKEEKQAKKPAPPPPAPAVKKEPPPPPPPPTAEEMLAGLKTQCAASEEARKARHAAKPLFERLGGDAKVLAVAKDIINIHKGNDKIKHMFEKVDVDKLARTVTDFVSANTGGKAKYKGKDMKTAHAALNLTAADFMEAGKDVGIALQNAGVGPEETEEFMCIFVSLSDQVLAAK
jgi:hemoglobin